MYLGFPNRSDCDRARELASRSLDGDLSEFDLGVLRAHLQECAACAEVAAAMGEVTERVRTAVPMDPALRARAVARKSAAASPHGDP